MTLSSAMQGCLTQIREKAKGGKSVVFVSGNFNLLHLGHLRLLEFAAECGDLLVVGVNNDDTPGVLFPQSERHEGIRALSCVGVAVKLDSAAEEFLRSLRPDVVVKGKEHEWLENVEREILKEYGGKLIFSSGSSHYSSADLLKKNVEQLNFSSIQKPTEFLERHGIKMSDLPGAVDRMKGVKVIVIGDTIVDDYITCDTLGLSQEDPTIVVTPVHTQRFVGGAGIVASHAAGLGASVSFFSVVGEDGDSEFVRQSLDKNKVKHFLYTDVSRPTTVKQRFRTKEKTLLRVSHLRQHSISDELINEVRAALLPQIDEADLVVFSDFNYGCLPQKLVDIVISRCIERGVKMVADSQSSSQNGNITRFRNMELVTPTEREARLGMTDFESGLVVLTDNLRKKSSTKNVFITLGAEGLLIRAPDEKGEAAIDKLPPFNSSPKDTAGAGDSMLIAASLALASGSDIWTSAYIGSIAAAIQVARIGNFPIHAEDLKKEIFL